MDAPNVCKIPKFIVVDKSGQNLSKFYIFRCHISEWLLLRNRIHCGRFFVACLSSIVRSFHIINIIINGVIQTESVCLKSVSVQYVLIRIEATNKFLRPLQEIPQADSLRCVPDPETRILTVSAKNNERIFLLYSLAINLFKILRIFIIFYFCSQFE